MMEHGFFHPERGYWQTVGEPSAEILATYLEGTVEVPLKPGADYEWLGGQWVHTPPALEELRESFPTLSPRQVRLGLLSIGVTNALVEVALGEDEAALIEWHYATSIERSHPLVDSLADHFELPPEQVDSLWLWAAEL